MVDLVALASLFVDVFGASKEWTEPKIVRLDPPSAAEQEPSACRHISYRIILHAPLS